MTYEAHVLDMLRCLHDARVYLAEAAFYADGLGLPGLAEEIGAMKLRVAAMEKSLRENT